MATPPLASLEQVATAASTVSHALSRYSGLVPDAAPEISATVTTLYSLSTTMHQFADAVQDYQLTWVDAETMAILMNVMKSSTKSLKELDKLVFKMELTSGSKGSSFKRVWRDVSQTFKEDSTTQIRLDACKERMSLLLAGLHASVNRNRQPTKARLDDYERRRYEDEINSPISQSSFDFPSTPLSPQSPTTAPTSPISPRRGRSSFGHRERQMYDKAGEFMSHLPPNPHFPLPPRPKTSFVLRDSEFVQYVDPVSEGSEGSNSSQSSTDRYKAYYHPESSRERSREQSREQSREHRQRRKSQSNLNKLNLNVLVDGVPTAPATPSTPVKRGSMGKPEHWASRVYSGLETESKFQHVLGHRTSECYGNPMEVHRQTGEEELLKLKFASDFTVRFWRHEMTHRSRIVCQVGGRRSASRFDTVMDLSYLTIRRSGSSLELNFKENLWAILSFSNMEDLVIFYTTFLVLRQLGPNAPKLEPCEIDLEEEELLFSGVISDDEGGRHYFRVFRDDDSGAVRVTASMKGGEHDELPVWTAFVNDSINVKGWMVRQAARIRLRSLHLISFSDMYDTKSYPDWELMFMGREDAKDFEKVFKVDLRNRV